MAPLRPEVTVAKLTNLLDQTKPVQKQTALMRSQELGRRVGSARSRLAQGDARGAFQQARAPLAGELPTAQFTPPGELPTAQFTPPTAGISPEEIGVFELNH